MHEENIDEQIKQREKKSCACNVQGNVKPFDGIIVASKHRAKTSSFSADVADVVEEKKEEEPSPDNLTSNKI